MHGMNTKNVQIYITIFGMFGPLYSESTNDQYRQVFTEQHVLAGAIWVCK
jgi:hypothetical protein